MFRDVLTANRNMFRGADSRAAARWNGVRPIFGNAPFTMMGESLIYALERGSAEVLRRDARAPP